MSAHLRRIASMFYIISFFLCSNALAAPICSQETFVSHALVPLAEEGVTQAQAETAKFYNTNDSEAYYWASLCKYTAQQRLYKLPFGNSWIQMIHKIGDFFEQSQYQMAFLNCHKIKARSEQKLSPDVKGIINQKINAWIAAHPIPKAQASDPISVQDKAAMRLAVESFSPYYDIEGILKILKLEPNLQKRIANLGQMDDSSGKMGGTPILVLLAGSSPDILAATLKTHPNLHTWGNDGLTPLMQASQQGLLENMKMLIDAGDDVNACKQFGVTVLDLARQSGQKEATDLLIKSGAVTNSLDTKVSSYKYYFPPRQVPSFVSNPSNPFDSTLKTLRMGTSEEKTAMIEKITAHADAYSPAVLHAMAIAMIHKMRDEEAFFWLKAAELRNIYDERLCHGAMGYIETTGDEFFLDPHAFQKDAALSSALFNKVADWDAATPINYYGSSINKCPSAEKWLAGRERFRGYFRKRDYFTVWIESGPDSQEKLLHFAQRPSGGNNEYMLADCYKSGSCSLPEDVLKELVKGFLEAEDPEAYLNQRAQSVKEYYNRLALQWMTKAAQAGDNRAIHELPSLQQAVSKP